MPDETACLVGERNDQDDDVRLWQQLVKIADPRDLGLIYGTAFTSMRFPAETP